MHLFQKQMLLHVHLDFFRVSGIQVVVEVIELVTQQSPARLADQLAKPSPELWRDEGDQPLFVLATHAQQTLAPLPDVVREEPSRDKPRRVGRGRPQSARGIVIGA